MGLDLVRSSCGKNKRDLKNKPAGHPSVQFEAAFVLTSSVVSLSSAAVGDEQPGGHYISLEKVQIGFAWAGVPPGL